MAEATRPVLVYLEWQDIATYSPPWAGWNEQLPPSKCFSVGWLVLETADYLTITATYSDDWDEDNKRHALLMSTIPKGCITKQVAITPEQRRTLDID